jgi:glycosyltransferase involved in cell wall biosynthesis
MAARTGQGGQVEGSMARRADAAAACRVLIVISTHVVGGPGKGLIQIIPELNADGRVVPMLHTFKRHDMADTPFLAACREKGIAAQVLTQRFNYDPRPLFALARIVREQGAQVIQTHGYKENLFGLVLKLVLRKRWICFLHGTTDENLKVRFYHLLDRLVVRFADRIVAVSRELAERTVPRRRFHKVRVVENAIAARTVEPNPFLVAGWKAKNGIDKKRVITSVGRLSPEKGHVVLLEAVRRLADTGLSFQLLLVGDGPLRAELEKKCERLRLRSYVRFLGEVKEMDLVYGATDIFVLPSFKEGMPNVVLEGMSHGLPMVVTRVGAIPDMLREGVDALLVPPGDIMALSRALQHLLMHPQAARALGQAAKKAVFPRFSVGKRAENLITVYRELEQDRDGLGVFR